MRQPAIMNLDKALHVAGSLKTTQERSERALATYLSGANSPNLSQMLTFG